MIIKTGGIRSGDSARITDYAVRQGDNELVEILRNDNDQLLVADDFAAAKGRKHGLLHIIISPDQALTPAGLKQTVDAINEEFGFNPNDPQTLSMHKHKDGDGISRKHWHLVRPAANSETGKTYRMFRSKAKDEAVSRLMEFELGHKLTSGANNPFAEKRLREMGRDDLADRLAAELGDERPKAAFNADQHQQAKRAGFDLPALRQSLKELAELPSNEQARALAQLMHDQGLELAPAENGRRTRIKLELPNDGGSLDANRTLKIRKAAPVAEFITETKEHLNDLRSDTKPESRSDHQGSAIADHRRPEPDSRVEPSNDQTAKHDHSGIPSNQQELKPDPEAKELAAAAAAIKPQAKAFSSARSAELGASDLDPMPDPRDPNLLKKLSAILRKQMQKVAQAIKQGLGPSHGMPG